MRITIKAELVAIQDGIYVNYVFKNLDEQENSFNRYITITKCPNWEGNIPNLNEIGYVEYESVNAGDNYFEKATGLIKNYNYTNCYFINFIKEQKEQINNKEFNF